MALTGFTASIFLWRTAAVLTAYPLMLSAWVNNTVAGVQSIVSLDLSTDVNQRAAIIRLNNLQPQATAFDTFAFVAATSTAVTSGAWRQFSGCFLLTTQREVRHTGGNFATDGTSCAPATPDRTWIGTSQGSEASAPSGAIAEVSIWDLTGVSTVADRDALDAKLAAGGNPLNITAEGSQPWSGKLRAYWPLLNTSDLADASGNGHLMTMQGSLTTFGSHPTIDAEGPQTLNVVSSEALLVGDTRRELVP